MRVGHPSEIKLFLHISTTMNNVTEAVNIASVNLRATDYLDGAGGRFVTKQLNIRDGVCHLKGVFLRHVLLVLLLFNHHHHGIREVLQRNKKME